MASVWSPWVKITPLRTWDVLTATEEQAIKLPSGTESGLLLGPGRVLLKKTDGPLSVWDSELRRDIITVRTPVSFGWNFTHKVISSGKKFRLMRRKRCWAGQFQA